MKKTFILSLLPSILLMSCGEFKPFGLYQFRLGKTDGNHLELNAELTDVEHGTQKGYNKMVLSADLGQSMSPAAIIESYEDKYPILEDFLEIITSELKELDHIDGFYKLTNIKNAKYGYRVDIGTDMLVEYAKKLSEKYPELKEIIDDIGPDTLVFMPENTRNLFTAYVNKKAFTIQMPVSGDDLTMQSIWYGNSSLIQDENYIEKMPGVKGEERYGTHPKYVVKNGVVIEDEISQVNELFKKDFSKTAIYSDELCLSKIATLVEEKADNVTKVQVFFEEDYTGSKTLVSGYVETKSMLGEFDDVHAIEVTLDAQGYITCPSNGQTGRNAGFIDENGEEFKYSYLIQPPFEFRDFHVVNVGLSKVVD